MLVGLDLPVHEPADGRLEGGQPPQRFAHRRNLVDAVRLAHAAREPHDQAHLGPEAHVRLLVLVAVGRRLDIDASRHRPVVVQEDALDRREFERILLGVRVDIRLAEILGLPLCR